jgi:hypothetical protein
VEMNNATEENLHLVKLTKKDLHCVVSVSAGKPPRIPMAIPLICQFNPPEFRGDDLHHERKRADLSAIGKFPVEFPHPGVQQAQQRLGTPYHSSTDIPGTGQAVVSRSGSQPQLDAKKTWPEKTTVPQNKTRQDGEGAPRAILVEAEISLNQHHDHHGMEWRMKSFPLIASMLSVLKGMTSGTEDQDVIICAKHKAIGYIHSSGR